ncbi:hypothetical protein L1049_000641 [Liquidambar formosana]|uniref:Serine carboxypeptidase-like 18 n=1 Tax=Liquidambar formosana TaxID=63359 RepID=A0AAP0R7V7_LIQFO
MQIGVEFLTRKLFGLRMSSQAAFRGCGCSDTDMGTWHVASNLPYGAEWDKCKSCGMTEPPEFNNQPLTMVRMPGMALGAAPGVDRCGQQNLCKNFISCTISMIFRRILVLSVFLGIAMSQTSVKTLPGYSGELPFTLETGYIGVGDSEDVQLFYYFVESQRTPSEDPLMVWFTGGPGCSTILSFFYESGPLGITYADYNGSLPSLHLNPYTWTKGLNMIYVDSPVGTGFSYSTTSEGYYTGDINSAALAYQFLRKAAKKSCNADFVNVDSSNQQCEADLQIIAELIQQINTQQILEPSCSMTSLKAVDTNLDRRSLRESSKDILLSSPKGPAFWCRNYGHVLAGIWANDESVQEALSVRKGTKTTWKMCNSSLAYTNDLTNVVNYHVNFTKKDIRALIYSGDHDMSIPHIGTREWIMSLNMTLYDAWRPWYVDAQVAGYTEEYTNDDYVLNFVTVKGAGHIAAEYKQGECSAMIERWFAYYPL